jgi:hypothetical protein
VWEYSARKVFGDSAHIICRHTEPPDYNEPIPTFARGSKWIGPSKTLSWREKIRNWADIVGNAPTGAPVLMTDVDIAFFQNPFPEVLVYKFDVAMCGVNTGAVYFRGNENSHVLMARWAQLTENLILDAELYQELDAKHKGLDQATMALLREENENVKNAVVILPLRFHSTIHNYELPAYLMHFHSKMRATVINNHPLTILPPEVRRYSKAWSRMLRKAESNETN